MQEHDRRGAVRAIGRGRTAMLLTGAAAALLLAVLAVTGRPFIIEQWHLWRLGSSDPKTRAEALAYLTDRESEAAVGRLVELIAASLEKPMVGDGSNWIELMEEDGKDQEVTTLWHRTYGSAIPFLTGPDAVRPLRLKLRSVEPKERVTAAYLLGRAGPTAIKACEDLLELSEVDPSLAWPAAAALGHISWRDPEGVRKMVEKVRREDTPWICVFALTQVYMRASRSEGETSKIVVPIAWEALVHAARNGDPEKRRVVLDHVGNAIIDLHEPRREAVDLLESAAGDPDPQVRKKARELLEDLHMYGEH
jgi:hypothetical protein